MVDLYQNSEVRTLKVMTYTVLRKICNDDSAIISTMEKNNIHNGLGLGLGMQLVQAEIWDQRMLKRHYVNVVMERPTERNKNLEIMLSA